MYIYIYICYIFIGVSYITYSGNLELTLFKPCYIVFVDKMCIILDIIVYL